MSWLFGKRDTHPVIGDYEFTWTNQGNIKVTDRKGKSRTYGVEALRHMTGRGMAQADKDMANAALDWAATNPFGGTNRDYDTTPNL